MTKTALTKQDPVTGVCGRLSHRIHWLWVTCTAVLAFSCVLPSLAGGQLAMSPAQIQFSDQAVSTTSTLQTITVVNNGAAVTIGAILLSGPDAVNYAATNGCFQLTLASGASCTIGVSFAPLHTGAAQSTLYLGDVIGTSIATVQISGNATGSNPTYVVPVTGQRFLRRTNLVRIMALPGGSTTMTNLSGGTLETTTVITKTSKSRRDRSLCPVASTWISQPCPAAQLWSLRAAVTKRC